MKTVLFQSFAAQVAIVALAGGYMGWVAMGAALANAN